MTYKKRKSLLRKSAKQIVEIRERTGFNNYEKLTAHLNELVATNHVDAVPTYDGTPWNRTRLNQLLLRFGFRKRSLRSDSKSKTVVVRKVLVRETPQQSLMPLTECPKLDMVVLIAGNKKLSLDERRKFIQTLVAE